MLVSSACCLLQGKGLCDRQIALQMNSTDCVVIECDLESSRMGSPGPRWAVAP